MALKTRKPTGIPSWPLILIEGEEKSGKSWSCAEFSGCDRVGETYWIELGEGRVDEYGAIPGADYNIVEHDGTWASILDAVIEVGLIGKQELAAGRKPVVLVIDSMTAEWDILKGWAELRARSSEKSRKKLEADPDAYIDVTTNYWNDANSRHRKLMQLLMTFPGIALMTARGKLAAEMDKKGQPTGEMEYKVEGQKHLAFDASAWVRLSRERPPQVIGVTSTHIKHRPGIDQPKPAPNFSIEWLVFDVLKCGQDSAVRGLISPSSTEEPVRPQVSSAQITEYEEKLARDGITMDEVNSLQNEARHAGEYDTAGKKRMREAIEAAKQRIARNAIEEAA